MDKKIEEIPRRESSLTESELQVVVSCLWLKIGIPGIAGGEMLSKWIEQNSSNVESIFGADDRVYIRMKTQLASKELVEFIVNEKIGDELQWIKCKESDHWWLMVWWD